jgi:hypothetical protein
MGGGAVTACEAQRNGPFIPVLKGWTQGNYCAELYAAAGVDLTRCEKVGLGSVCRRQSTIRIGLRASWMAASGSGCTASAKTEGLGLYGEHLVSCDSLAWSYDARRSAPLPGHAHKNCTSCLSYAMGWRQRMLADLGDSRPALEVAA